MPDELPDELPDLNGIEKRWRDQRFSDFRLWEWLVNRARASVRRGDIAGLSRFVERMALLYSRMVQKDQTRFITNGFRDHQREQAAINLAEAKAQAMPRPTGGAVATGEIELPNDAPLSEES